MAASRITHDERERPVLTDLDGNFPKFTGQARLWEGVPVGQDPPDFISHGPGAPIGLELVEWLDGDQMGPAKTRESQQVQLHRVLAYDWEKEYQPKNFSRAFPSPLHSERIARSDELSFRQEFFACAAETDHAWVVDSDRRGITRYQTEFPGYPFLGKYLNAIRYSVGEPQGACWIGVQGHGTAFDPTVRAETLKKKLNKKLSDYSTPEKQAHLKAYGLTELNLLVHGGFNIYAYNTSSGHLSLEEIARRGANYYAAHVHRWVFDHVWFFYSLAPSEGRVRWLAQLWPDFRIYPGSVPR
jgi:hypothetical protein